MHQHHEPLAIDGGRPAFADFAPRGPAAHPTVRASLAALAADDAGAWSHYGGVHGERLTERLCQTFELPHCRLCSSGTIGVELALRGLQIGPGDEVVLAGYDFPGNFRAIEATGATPVLAEIEPRRWRIDSGQLASAVGPKTRAVIVSHLHGDLTDMRSIQALAAARKLAIIEDACQAPGATVAGRPPGALADVCVLSFGGSKLLTAGRGGAVLTRRDDVQQRLKVYAERGNDAFPLSELQAAVLLPQLALLPELHAQRAVGADRLRERLRDLAMLRPVECRGAGHSPAYYKVAWDYEPAANAAGQSVDERIERVVRAAEAEGIPLGRGFRGFARRSPRRCRKPLPLPHAERAADHTLLLHHAVLLESDAVLDRLAAAMRKVLCHPAL